MAKAPRKSGKKAKISRPHSKVRAHFWGGLAAGLAIPAVYHGVSSLLKQAPTASKRVVSRGKRIIAPRRSFKRGFNL